VKAGLIVPHSLKKLSKKIFWPKFQLTELDNDGAGIGPMRRPPLVSFFLHFLPRLAEENGLIETVRKIKYNGNELIRRMVDKDCRPLLCPAVV
jgi:hypothetical protein